MKYKTLLFCLMMGCTFPTHLGAQPYNGEKLSRGFVGISDGHGMQLSWRMFITDKTDMPLTFTGLPAKAKQSN